MTSCSYSSRNDEEQLSFTIIFIFQKNQQDRTGQPKIWIYRDKITNEPTGDATVTYEDPHAALTAVEWFHNKDFHGSIIEVYMAQLKTKDSGDQSYGQQVNHAADPAIDGGLGGQDDVNGGGGKGRGRGDASANAWQQDGDWLCPNTRVCNRCGTARPTGVGGINVSVSVQLGMRLSFK